MVVLALDLVVVFGFELEHVEVVAKVVQENEAHSLEDQVQEVLEVPVSLLLESLNLTIGSVQAMEVEEDDLVHSVVMINADEVMHLVGLKHQLD